MKKEVKEVREPESNRNAGRVSSITRRIHWYMLRKKAMLMIGQDLFCSCAYVVFWLLLQEYEALGYIPHLVGVRRIFERSAETGKILYSVLDKSGGPLVQADASLLIRGTIILMSVVLLMQFVSLVTHYRKEDGEIRGILNPINEIALRADELSRLSFTEDKYQLIEDAITRIQPQDSETLSFGDRDLTGIEAAMNNLLRRMRDTYRQQARFVNDASHELRTPIAVIQGYAGLLARWGRDDEKIMDEAITAICNESDHMKHLVEQLLFLARGDSGTTAFTPEDIQLDCLMREVYEESFMIDEKHVYRFEADPEPITIRADCALLKQAVRILIDNAVKFTPEGNEIFLSCGREDAENVYLQVQDTGIGMEGKDVSHMFERFYRSDEARNYQGTGLGLSIAKWIVDRHRGHFEILSRLGIGTRIRIVLPVSGIERKN